MGFVSTEQHRKKAFRVAYDFLEKHNGTLWYQEEYKGLGEDLGKAFAQNDEDPLACRLLSAVFDYICATSKAIDRKGNEE